MENNKENIILRPDFLNKKNIEPSLDQEEDLVVGQNEKLKKEIIIISSRRTRKFNLKQGKQLTRV
jgi:hypothetical protein